MMMVDRVNWIDIAVQMQNETLGAGRVRVVCSVELLEERYEST